MFEKPQMLTLKEASKEVEGITEYRLREMCKNNEIPHVKAGNKYLINKNVLYRYLNGDFFVPNTCCNNPPTDITPVKV